MRLGELLLKKELISEDKLQVALSYQKVTDTFLGEALIRLNFISSYELAKALAEQAEFPLSISQSLLYPTMQSKWFQKRLPKKWAHTPSCA